METVQHVAATKKGPGATSGRRVESIHNARAIAIAIIVLGHCYTLAWGSEYGEETNYDWVINVITGGTAVFVFISGFLFHHVFYPRFAYKKFVVQKLQRIAAPYIIISTFMFVAFHLHPSNIREWNDIYILYILTLFSGQAGPSLWYVPFIMIIFAISPVFVKFIDARKEVQIAILLISLGIGFFVNRSLSGADPIQCVFYFSFYYLLGIWVSINFQSCRRIAGSYYAILLSFSGVALLADAQLDSGYLGNYTGDYFEWTGFDYMYLQKVLLIVFVLGSMEKFAEVMNTWPLRDAAGFSAHYSFAIFFLHNIVIYICYGLFGAGEISFGGKFLSLLFFGLLSFFVRRRH